jgi:hypothetical protein
MAACIIKPPSFAALRDVVECWAVAAAAEPQPASARTPKS